MDESPGVGDVVKLKTGGLEMIIAYVNGYDCRCVWASDEAAGITDWFPLEFLTVIRKHQSGA